MNGAMMMWDKATQSNNKKAQNQQPEENYEKSDEKPQLSYVQLHARNAKKAQENEVYQRASHEQAPHPSFGRNNQPQVHYDLFEHQVDPHMATFGRK